MILIAALAAAMALSPAAPSRAQNLDDSGVPSVTYDEKQLATADDPARATASDLTSPASRPATKPAIALDLGPNIGEAAGHRTAKAKSDFVPAKTEVALQPETLPRLAITTEPPAPLPTERLYGAARNVPNSGNQATQAPPQDLVQAPPDSASIEHLSDARNLTVVVPLFRVLDSISTGPAPQP